MQQEIPHKYGLVTDFKIAARRFKKRLPSVLQAQADHIPLANLGAWNRGDSYNNNCYNFARNLRSSDFLQPGQLVVRQRAQIANDNYTVPTDLPAPVSAHPILSVDFRNAMPAVYGYAQHVVERLQQDQPAGWIGYDLNLYPGGWPVALFFRNSSYGGADFHWYPLRRTGRADSPGPSCGFAHKMGSANASWVPGNDIFKNAKKTGYQYFAGFFHFDPV
jgi:hypothetical protein